VTGFGRTLAALCVAALLAVAALLLVGPADIGPDRVAAALGSAVGLVEPDSVPPTERFVVLQLRLPQAVLIALVGAALACSGAALQATFANPLADSGVLGVTGGAALGAVIAVHLGWAERIFLALPLAAFVGAAAAAGLVYVLCFLGGRRPTTYSLLLTGVAVGSTTVAGVSLVMILVEQHRLAELLFWLVGGVRNQGWDHVVLAAVPIAAGCGLLLLLHRPLDAMLTGEEHALAVGVNVVRLRLIVLAAVSLAAGAATAVAGGIGFVGLMVPHMLRRFTGPTADRLLPASLFAGAAFLSLCELAARVLPERFHMHPGILTAFLGGPAFLILLRRRIGEES